MSGNERLGGYHYVSNRLISRVLEMPEVPRPRPHLQIDEVTAEVSTGGPKFGGKATVQPWEETLQERAARATEVLRRQTGTIDEPSKPYLRMRIDAYMSTFNVPQGWEWDGVETNSWVQSVMLLASGQAVLGKRVFVGLLGSAHNLMNSGVGQAVGYTQGRTPSDIEGLYELFSQIREGRDARVQRNREERSHNMTDLELARDTMNLAQGSPGDGPPRRVEVLFQRHRPALIGSIDLDPDLLAPYNLVLIGAPLWIREVTSDGGAPAQPAMDRIGTASHQYYNVARQKSLEIAQRVIAANAEFKSLDDRFRQLTQASEGPQRTTHDNPLTDPRVVAGRIHEIRAVKENALEEYADHEQSVIERASDPGTWPDFAEWFVTQAALEGIPLVALSFERKPSAWRRLFKRNDGAPPPEQTNIAGVVVTIIHEDGDVTDRYLELGSYRDAQFRDLRFPGKRRVSHVFVTPTGDIYPVSVWSYFTTDPRARVVYSGPQATEGGLRRKETPRPDMSLISDAVPAMLEVSMRWRITFKRSVPEVPWLSRGTAMGLYRSAAESEPPTTISNRRILEILRGGMSETALDEE